MLVMRRGHGSAANATDPGLPERLVTFQGVLAAVAASRWQITDEADVTRAFASLTDEQQRKLHAAVNFMLPWGGGDGKR